MKQPPPIQRGELWWVNLDPTQGSEIKKTRPCLVISHNSVNRLRKTVVVIPLSSSAREHPPITVKVSCKGKQVVAVIDQIRSVAKHRLKGRIDNIENNEMSDIIKALTEILDITLI